MGNYTVHLAHIELKIKQIEDIIAARVRQHAPMHHIFAHQIEVAILKELLEEFKAIPDLPPGVSYDQETKQLKYKDFTADSFKEMDLILREEKEIC